MTKPELLREIGIHLKKVVDIYNQLAKNPEAFTPGEIDMMVNNAAKIIEYAAVVKHQPASASNTDEQIRLRDLEDKLRVANEQLKGKDFEIEKLQRTNQELEKKVEENKHLADAFSVDIPEISNKMDANSTLAKTDLLDSSFITEIPIIEKKEPSLNTIDAKVSTSEGEKEQKNETFNSTSFVTEKKVEPVVQTSIPTSLVSKYENDNDGGSKKTVMSSLNESIIDGSKENVAEKLMKTQVTDLSKVIPLHEKFHITNELFGKNNEHYTQFIDAMNGKQSWKEAEQLLAQAASMYKWDPENKTALNFIALIQRRFN
jgi:hypothetical protein